VTDDHRNPYLILGIPYGSSQDEARHAAARVIRRIKDKPDSVFALEDVNWALYQVDQVNLDPEAGVLIYRVPANPQLFGPREQTGIFSPPPMPYQRTTHATGPEEMRAIALNALPEIAARLLEKLATELIALATGEGGRQ
jgi:hypothetical protein